MKKILFNSILIIAGLLVHYKNLAQNGDAFVSNLNVSVYGMISNDIAYGSNTDKVFVYGLKKILVFNGNDESGQTVVNFDGNDNEYGQYQFPFNGFEDLPVQKMMAADNNNNYMYVVTPKLNMIRINMTTNQKDQNFFIQSPTGTELAGGNIIRFDATHNRLYWAYKIKDQNGFHLGVYHVNGNNVTLINSFNDYYSQSDPAYEIFDIAFNETNNVFYLSRNGSYEIWEIVGNNLVLRETISIGILDRTGKLIYVHNSNIHKVFCLPFGTSYAPATVYVIDGDNYHQQAQFAVAYRKVRTGIFDESNGNLIIGYLQDGETGCPNYDIAVYHNSNGNYSLLQTLNTGNTTTGNSPLFIEKKEDNFLVCKNDEVVLLTHSENPSAPYNAQTIVTNKSNFYIKSIVTNDYHAYTLKAVSSGVEAINPDNMVGTEINTGAITYQAAFGKLPQKAYFFSRQHYQKSRITIMDTKTNGISTLTTDNPVGDVVYNPYTNEFIVIENKNEATSFKVYNAVTDALSSEHTTGLANCERMFIDPNNRLYVTGNMLPQNGSITINIYNATDYGFITSKSFNYNTTLTDGFVKADFVYNYHNNCVYGVFHTFYTGFSPAAQTPQTNDGVLIKIDNNYNITTYTQGMNLPAKIVCDNSASTLSNYTDTQYDGTCFIRMLSGTVVAFDCHNETITNVGVDAYSDITYDPFSDLVYGVVGGTQGTIYSIDKNGTQTSIYSSDKLSQCRSVNYNRYNDRLYFYVVKSDNSQQTKLFSIDPKNVVPGLKDTYLHNRSIDIIGDNDFYFHNDLVFDPLSNRLFIPNGTHGNIIVVHFDPNEPLYLRNKITWLSIPRNQGNSGSGYWETSDVLKKSNFEIPYNTLYIEFFNAQIQNPQDFPYHATFNIDNQDDWDFQSDLDNTFSVRGYKLTLNPDNENILYMQGNVADPSTPVTLYCNKENWVGYFLYKTQNVFDALGSYADNIYLIKHQDFTCYKYHYPVSGDCNTKSTADYPPGTWICEGKPRIKYGDMLMIKPNTDISNFQWSRFGPQNTDLNRPEPQYYVYDEKADYTTMVIELDTSQTNPVEIGAFVNDTCIGSTSVLATDSVVVLRAYLEGQPQDSVTFEEHYAARSVENKKIDNYYVLNAHNFKAEKRKISAGERKDFYLVSFRKFNNENNNIPAFEFMVYPNPAHRLLNYRYVLPSKSNVVISLYNMEGKRLGTLVNQTLKNGIYTGTWNLDKFTDKHIRKGIYVIKLSTGYNTAIRKIIVQ